MLSPQQDSKDRRSALPGITSFIFSCDVIKMCYYNLLTVDDPLKVSDSEGQVTHPQYHHLTLKTCPASKRTEAQLFPHFSYGATLTLSTITLVVLSSCQSYFNVTVLLWLHVIFSA